MAICLAVFVALLGLLVAPAAAAGSAMLGTLAGQSGGGLVNGIGTAAAFNMMFFIAVDSKGGAVYVADTSNNIVRAVNTSTAAVSTFAGSGTRVALTLNGAASAALFNSPVGVAVDAAGVVNTADYSSSVIRRIASGVVTTLCGNLIGFADGAATSARFRAPYAVIVDNVGSLFVADFGNHRIRSVNASTGAVTTLAGSGAAAFANGVGTLAAFKGPKALCIDFSTRTLYVADYSNYRVRSIVIATRLVSTLSGSGTAGLSVGAAITAQFYAINGIATDNAGSVFVADMAFVRLCNASTGAVSAYAGNGSLVHADGPALTSSFATLLGGLSFDATSGVLYAAEDNRVRYVYTRCEPGYFCGFPVGIAAAQACPIGFVCAASGLSVPTACTPGSFCESVGLTAVSDDCAAGHYCTAGSSSATQFACSSGNYCSTKSAAQTACALGSVCATSSVQVSCSLGNYCPAGSTAQVACAAGSACSSPSSQSACSPGQYCMAGTVSAAPCPPGSFCVTPSTQAQCGAGSYCPASSTAPTPCPTGFECLTVGLTAPQPVLVNASVVNASIVNASNGSLVASVSNVSTANATLTNSSAANINITASFNISASINSTLISQSIINATALTTFNFTNFTSSTSNSTFAWNFTNGTATPANSTAVSNVTDATTATVNGEALWNMTNSTSTAVNVTTILNLTNTAVLVNFTAVLNFSNVDSPSGNTTAVLNLTSTAAVFVNVSNRTNSSPNASGAASSSSDQNQQNANSPASILGAGIPGGGASAGGASLSGGATAGVVSGVVLVVAAAAAVLFGWRVGCRLCGASSTTVAVAVSPAPPELKSVECTETSNDAASTSVLDIGLESLASIKRVQLSHGGVADATSVAPRIGRIVALRAESSLSSATRGSGETGAGRVVATVEMGTAGNWLGGGRSQVKIHTAAMDAHGLAPQPIPSRDKPADLVDTFNANAARAPFFSASKAPLPDIISAPAAASASFNASDSMLPRSSPPQRVGARSLPPLESNKLFVPPSYLPPTIGARIPATVPGDILSQTNGLSKLLPSALPSLPSTVTSPPPSVNAAPSVGSDSCSDGGRFAVSSHNHKTAKIPSLTRRPLVIDGFYAESQNIDAPNARTALPNSFDSPETVPFTATDASLRPLSSTTFPPSYSILDPLPSQPSVMYPRTLVSMDTTLSAAIPGSHSTIANEHVAVLSNTSTSAFSNSPTLTLTPTGPSPIPPPAFAPAQSYSFSALLAASSSAFAAPTSASVSLLAHTTSSAGTAKALPPLRAGAARLSKSVVRLET